MRSVRFLNVHFKYLVQCLPPPLNLCIHAKKLQYQWPINPTSIALHVQYHLPFLSIKPYYFLPPSQPFSLPCASVENSASYSVGKIEPSNDELCQLNALPVQSYLQLYSPNLYTPLISKEKFSSHIFSDNAASCA